MSRIVVVTHGYPNCITPNSRPFLKELVEQWRKMGMTVDVIRPVQFLLYIRYKLASKKEKVDDAHNFFPLWFDFLFLKIFKNRTLQMRLSDKNFQRAVERVGKIDDACILYSHFLNSGYCVGALSEKYGCKAFCAVGESSLWTLKSRKQEEIERRLNKISGFISVSSENKRKLIESGLACEEKIICLPNAIDVEKFNIKDKMACREKLDLPQNEIIGIFVGHFIERKGPRRVAEAVKDIGNLKMIYIGEGEQQPEGSNILFSGRVDHDMIPYYLSSADFFILPTITEGCCNAILEAIACGLPVISSKGSFNDDILAPEYSIRVDPTDISEIRDAVITITQGVDIRDRMTNAAREMSESFNIKERATKILKFMGCEVIEQ